MLLLYIILKYNFLYILDIFTWENAIGKEDHIDVWDIHGTDVSRHSDYGAQDNL